MLFPALVGMLALGAGCQDRALDRLSPAGPGVNGNVVVPGFHPYFVEPPAGRALVRAAMSDFGELRRGFDKTSRVIDR